VLHAHRLPRGQETVSLDRASGRVLARDVRSDRDVPPFDRAAVDGYAFRLDGPWRDGLTFPVLGMIAAGKTWRRRLPPGAAVQIMTGAPVPQDADGVIPVESSRRLEDGRVSFTGTPGETSRPRIAPRGEDARRGDAVLLPGTVLEPSHVAILAGVGCRDVPVFRLPRVDVVVTGDELARPGRRPGASQIRDSNGPQLRAMLDRSRLASAVRVRRAADTERSLRTSIERGDDADVLVFTGGVSMGEFDLVPRVLADAGFRIRLHRLAIRPGKPFLFATRGAGQGRQAAFGLPGNPVSVLVTGWELLFPYLRAAAGFDAPGPEERRLRIDRTIRRPPGLAYFVLGRRVDGREGEPAVREVPLNGSGDYLALAWADCLIPLPAGDPRAEEGRWWNVHPLFRERAQLPEIPAGSLRHARWTAR
jgi:molybdopterin molybdotransferase